MKANSKLVAVAASLILALASNSAAFAKGHDQGVADGDFSPGDSVKGVSPLGGADVSLANSGGIRGSLASRAGLKMPSTRSATRVAIHPEETQTGEVFLSPVNRTGGSVRINRH
jgi:hypothetical protein